MFDKVQNAFWKALTPDLVADEPGPLASILDQAVLVALGGADNLKSEQRVALTRIRVELNDVTRMSPQALREAGVPGVMALTGGVVHLVVGLL
ncbi:MAG: PTS glucose transporter subunit IIB [Pseudomonadota bacterium]